MAKGTDGDGGKRIPRNKFAAKPKPLRVVKQGARLSDEDQQSYSALLDQLTQEKKPVNLAERKLVEDVALAYIRLQNARRLETETLNRYISELQNRLPKSISADKAMAIAYAEHADEIEGLQQKEVAIQDAWYHAMHELEREQNARRKSGAAIPEPAGTSDPEQEKIHLVKPRQQS